MVRDYRPSDLDRILKIWLQANIQAHDFIDRSYWEENSGLVRQLLPQARVFVWEQGGETRALPALLKKISRAFLSASNTAPRELERAASPGGKAPLPPAHIAGLPKKPTGFFVLSAGRVYCSRRKNGSGHR